jgi:exopolysaccharide biosynthesis polyprenyl glycosylphosphotransferase
MDLVAKSARKSLMMSRSYLFVKRGMDIVLCSTGIILLSPVFLIVALLIKLDSPGPILFRQLRIGKGRKPFYCLKFRSMTVDAEQKKTEVAHLNEVDGPVFKIRNDPRVTRTGKFLRKLSIDELPQLFNVLRGEMTLVGPRPPIPSEVDNYEEWMLRRLDVTPGITCLWQVSGHSNVTFEQWMMMDLEYIETCSVWKDIVILFRTIPAVFSGKGAY